MLVDGLIVEAQEITGSTKVFLRNDCGNSPLGRGFSFLALHIPASLGRDMEITLSVDPNRGVNLFKLWEAIERRETKAWEEAGEARPTKLPRKLEGADNIYEQPWYIDPTKTLLARPRALGNGHPGSRLEWKDIREILWQELNPLHGVSVSVPGTDTVLSLLDLNPEPGNPQHNKSFFAAKWVNIKGKDALLLPRTLLESKFLLRILAAMLHHRHPTRLIGYDDLPTHGSWDLVKLDGGLAIVNQDGVFILEDWSGKTLQISEIRSDFHCAATLDEEILHLEMNDLRPLVEDVQKLLNREHTVPGVDVLLLRSAHLGTRLAGLRGRYAVLPEDPEARLIRSAMEKRWSLDHRLSACEGETRAIETSLRSLSELSTLRIGRFIATYGFALVLATESCQFVSRAVYNLFQCSSTETDAPSLFNLGCFAVIAILLILGLRLWFTVERPLSRMITKEHQGR